jgi:DNA polymerase III subunit gamma/tau
MSHQVVYRKYRSADFSELIGQEHIVKTLSNEIKSSSVGHAYLFFGPRGTGKTSTARIFAKIVNCENPITQNDILLPCGKCDSCKSFNTDDIDIMEMDAASNRGIDDARLLREKAYSQPLSHKYKVIILDEAHMLTREAVNALLKIIEEPPQYMIFIFCTTEFHKIPITIASRCQRFKFHLANIDDIVKKLKFIVKEENKNIPDDKLNIIAKMAKGSFRDSESLLEQVLYSENSEDFNDLFSLYDENSIVKDLIKNILDKKDQEVWNILTDFEQSQGEVKQLLEIVLDIAKEMLEKNEINFDQYISLVKLIGGFRGGGKEEFFYIYSKVIKKDFMSVSTVTSTQTQSLNTQNTLNNAVKSNAQPIQPLQRPMENKTIQKPQPIQTTPRASTNMPPVNITNQSLNKDNLLNVFKNTPAIYNIVVKSRISIEGGDIVVYVNSTLHKIFLEKNKTKELIMSSFGDMIKSISFEIAKAGNLSSSEQKSTSLDKKQDNTDNSDEIEKIFNSKFE